MLGSKDPVFPYLIGDGHQPNTIGLYTYYKGGMTIPNITTLDHGTCSAPPGQVSFNTLPMSHSAIDMTGGNSNIFGGFARGR